MDLYPIFNKIKVRGVSSHAAVLGLNLVFSLQVMVVSRTGHVEDHQLQR